jgi:hypothetical protein
MNKTTLKTAILTAGLALSSNNANAQEKKNIFGGDRVSPQVEVIRPLPEQKETTPTPLIGKMLRDYQLGTREFIPELKLEMLSAPTPVDVHVLEGISTITTKREVKKGDYALKIEISDEVAGFLGLKVARVDKKGVELATDAEIFMSEHASGRPFRINFGGEKRFGEFALWTQIKVTKGKKPGTAIVEITQPDYSKMQTPEETK